MLSSDLHTCTMAHLCLENVLVIPSSGVVMTDGTPQKAVTIHTAGEMAGAFPRVGTRALLRFIESSFETGSRYDPRLAWNLL